MKKFIASISMLLAATVSMATEFTVGYAPGGPSDRATRVIGKYLPQSNYQIVNRPGAGGRIAVKHILRTDSMFLATMSQTYVTNTMANVEAGYDPKEDLEILGTAGVMPNVLACKRSLNINTVQDLDGKSFNFGVAGYGSSEHIYTETLFTRIKNSKHIVIPYAQGGAASVTDMLGGTLDCMFANYPTIKPFVNDERLRIVMSSHELGLGIPTWKDLYGENFPFQSYLSVVVSKTLDQDIKNRIKRDLEIAFANKDFREELRNIGLFVVAKTDNNSNKQVEQSLEKLRAFIISTGLKIN